MALVLTGNPYSDQQAKLAEIERMRRIRNEPLPGATPGGARGTRAVLRTGQNGLRLDGFERGLSSYTEGVSAAVAARGGLMEVTLTPMGRITGMPIRQQDLVLEMGPMGYQVTPL